MGSWTLLNPWLSLGLIGASLPILIHLIGRRRAPTVHFAAFDFLVAVNKRLARRERLRQILLLLLRTLAVAALVMAVARPMRERPAVAAVGHRRLMLVVDTSASMAFEYQGQTLLQHAKAQARQVLSNLQPGDSAALILAGAELRVPFEAPTLELSGIRNAIDKIGEPAGVADLGAAVDRALAMLGPAGNGATLVIISDLAANSFRALRPTALDPPPEVRLVDAAERASAVALPNLAVEAVTVERSGDAAAERRFHVLVRNFGATPVQGRSVELLVDDRVTQRGYVDVPARGSAEKTLTQSFDGPGVFRGRVQLAQSEAEGYVIDDAMSVVTVVAPGVSVLAVDGDPRTTPYEDELFFVERALQAIPKGDPPIRLTIATLQDLTETDAAEQLAAHDVVILANVGRLDPGTVEAVRAFVRDGGGLLFACGNNVRFESANELFGDLLAHPLRDRHRAADPDAGTPPLGIGDMDWDHPVLAGLGLAAEESLRASRTSVYFNLDVGAGVKARTVMRFDNGAPALVERPEGKGRVMLLTASLDVDYSDIALRSAFPALLQRAVRYLANAVESVSAGETRVGGNIELPVPTGARGLALVSPSGRRRELPVAEAGQRRVTFDDLDEVGVHRAQVMREGWVDEPRLDVAVNPSLEESDFIPIRAEQVAEALGGEGEAGVAVAVGTGRATDPFEQRGAASYLLLALALFFISESLLASRG